MPYTGLTINSTTGGIDFITTKQNNLNATITDEFLQISGSGSGINGNIDITRSQVSIFDPFNGTSNNRGGTSPIAYVNSNAVTDQNNSVSIGRSCVSIETFPGRRANLLISRLTDSILCETGAKNTTLVYTQPNGALANSTIIGVRWVEFSGSLSQFFNVSFIDTNAGILNYEAGRIDLIGANIPSTTCANYVAMIGEGNGGFNSFFFWNPVAVDTNKLLLMSDNNKALLGYTVSWKFKDISPVNDALVVYRDDRDNIGGSKIELARYTTDLSGNLTGTFDSKLGVAGANSSRPTLWVRTKQARLTGVTSAQNPSVVPTSFFGGSGQKEYIIDAISSEIEIRSYTHLAEDSIKNPAAEIGSIDANSLVRSYTDYVLTIDAGVTQPNRITALNVTGIAHTSTTIIISSSRSLAEIYDSRKAYWRDNGGIVGVRLSNTANFSNLNITIATGANITASTSKFSDGLQTSGILTLADARSYNSIPFAIITGGSVFVATGLTDLESWIFASGTTINASSGTATVTVNSTQIPNITPGTGVSVISAPVTFSGFPTVANANGYTPQSVFGIKNQRTNVTTTFNASSGSVEVSLSTLGIANDLFTIVADARGYYRTPLVTDIPIAFSGTFDFTNLFKAILNSDSLPICGLGISVEMARLAYNQPIGTFEVDGGGVSFASVVQKVDEITSTQSGLTQFDTNILRQLTSESNPYARTIYLPVPLKIQANATTTTSPVFTDFIIVVAGDTTGDPYTHSTRPEIQQRPTKIIVDSAAIAQIQSNGFVPSDRVSLDRLNATLVSPGIFSTASLANAPSGAGGGTTLTQQQIRDALTLATVATPVAGSIDSRLALIPTNPLLTSDTRLNSLDAAISTRASQSSVNAIPTADNSGNVAAIKTQTDKFVFTSIGRVDSTAIGVPTNPLLTSDTRLSNLDATISSRLASAGYATPPTVSAITTAVWANTVREITSGANIVLAKGVGITGLNDITAQSVLSLATSSQTSPGTIGKLLIDNINAPIALIPVNPLLANDSRLSNLDATISSRLASAGYATPPTVSAITTAVWANAVREITSGANIVLVKGVGVTGLNDITAQSVLSLATSSQTSIGSIGKLLTDNINAPIALIPTNSLLTNDARLNFLDGSIVANAPINVWGYVTRTLTSVGGGSLTAADVWNYTTRSLTTPFPSVPTAAENAGTVRTNLSIELARLDASISSRATANDVWSAPIAGLTQLGTIGRLLHRTGKAIGVSSANVTASTTSRSTSDGDISQTITSNPDGSKTIAGSP